MRRSIIALAAVLCLVAPLASQGKRELIRQVLSTATDYQGIAGVVEIVKSYPEVYDYLPHLNPLGTQSYRLSSAFGYRRDPLGDSSQWHRGIDMASDYACRVYASASGKVVYAGTLAGYGKCIIIEHRYGFKTYYAHLTHLHATKGQVVRGGVVIGFVGSTGRSTGNHLHYEIRKDDRSIDPMPFLGL